MFQVNILQSRFRGSFKEATERKIHFLDEDPKVFKFYAMWIYNQGLKFGKAEEQLKVDDCCRLYILAEKLGSESLQNLVIDEICDCALDGKRVDCIDLTASTINFVYGATLPTSRLRSILVDTFAWQLAAENVPGLIDAVPEYLFEVLKICTRRLPIRLSNEVGPLDEDKCETYHIHRNGESCQAPQPVSDNPNIR